MSVFWWVELDLFSLECNDVSSDEFWGVYEFGYAKAFDCVDHKKLEYSERDENTRPLELPLQKSICRPGSNS